MVEGGALRGLPLELALDVPVEAVAGAQINLPLFLILASSPAYWVPGLLRWRNDLEEGDVDLRLRLIHAELKVRALRGGSDVRPGLEASKGGRDRDCDH